MPSGYKVKIGYVGSLPDDLKMNISVMLDNSVENEHTTADNRDQKNDKVDESENYSSDNNDDKVEGNNKEPYPVTVIKCYHTYNKTT